MGFKTCFLKNTKIGKGLYIGNHGIVVINKNAFIGDYCTTRPGVTLGQDNKGKLKGYPILGDYVWGGTNAVIAGNVRIGTNVLIAPNSFVNFDVPDNSLVLGNPGKIIKKENPTEGYIINVFNQLK